MKIISKYLSIALIASCLVACADLDLNPLSEGSSENWYNDETEIEIRYNSIVD